MRRILFLFVCLGFLLVSCEKPDNNKGGVAPTPPTPTTPTTPTDPTASVVIASGTDLNPSISSSGGNTQIKFTAYENWTASVTETKSVDWISIDKTSGGPGDITITVTIKENDTYDSRSATLKISSGSTTIKIEFTQKQSEEEPELAVGQHEYEVGCGEGEVKIEVSGNVSCYFQVSEYWLWLNRCDPGNPSTYFFQISKNYSNESRTAEISFINDEYELKETVKITQGPYNLVEFYDSAFKDYCVKNFDSNGDGEISLDEAKEARKIDYTAESMDLKGLEAFVNLETLKLCSGKTDVESAQNCWMSMGETITALTKLKHLESRYTALYNLDISRMADLEYLDVEGTRIQKLDISNNTKLTYLDCSPIQYNNLQSLVIFNGQTIPNVTENRSAEYIPEYTIIYNSGTSTGGSEGTMEGGEI